MPLIEGYIEEKITVGGGRPSHPIAPGGTTPPWGIEGPVDPGYGVPLPPIVSHPIAPGGGPSHPIAPGGERPTHPIAPPTYPVDPDYDLPLPPTVWPQPPHPPEVWPGPPVRPSHPIYPVGPGSGGEGQPEHPIALPPGSVWPPLPPGVTGQLTCFVWIVGVGYRWTTIDTSLKPTHPIVIPPSTVPGVPTHPIAPGGERPSTGPVPPGHVSGQPVPPGTRPDQGLPPTEPTPRGTR